MTTTTKKSAADLAFERKVARIARSVAKLAIESSGIVGEGYALGLSPEQIGGLSLAFDTLIKASRRFGDAAEGVKENI